jgi:2,3-bisphosphoglycerate-independent phosphoglycerate mutase
MDLNFAPSLTKSAKTKIMLLVMDGLGGTPNQESGLTELETANTPHLDDLASKSICGLQEPVGPGITPGSGPGHLALFGYDPLKYQVGRGVLSALGIDFDLNTGDVAARGNFCTTDDQGLVSDRRAGRISTEKNSQLCELLREIELPQAKLFVETVKEHRFLLVLRGKNLSGEITDTDPQEVGKEPREIEPLSVDAQKAASLVRQFLDHVRDVLADQHPANMVLLRGFSQLSCWPSFQQVFGLRAAAVAGYPMYRGVAKLVGMESLKSSDNLEQEIRTVEENWKEFDFFYLHVKPIDSAGEDGDFDRKVALIEEVDDRLPRILKLKPDVMVVTGDHSTPCSLKAHSWHPVPVLLWSENCRPDRVDGFGERSCLTGGLGARFPARELLPLALANAKRLDKFGA